jgi:hypothetical protein
VYRRPPLVIGSGGTERVGTVEIESVVGVDGQAPYPDGESTGAERQPTEDWKQCRMMSNVPGLASAGRHSLESDLVPKPLSQQVSAELLIIDAACVYSLHLQSG